MKTICFALCFILCNVYIAQEKFEFMTISYDTYNERICVSINGKEFVREPVVLADSVYYHLNTNPLLEKVLEFQNKSWELINMSTLYFTPVDNRRRMNQEVYYTHMAYLKRKMK